ncbi:MAG: tetratricopeptide repeat protein [Nitrospiria bacterium]
MPFFILLFFALMGAVGYLATLNPNKVTLFLNKGSSVELSITALILFSTALGGLLVIVSFGVREIKHIVLNWKETRKKKQSTQIDLYHTDAVNAFLAKRYRDAAALFKKILALDPNHISTLLRLGHIYQIEGNFTEAIRMHRKARSLDDQNIEVLLALSLSLEKAQRFEEAMQYLKEILQLDGTNLTALTRLRDLTMRIQQWEDTHPLQERILKLHLSEEEKEKEQKILLGVKYEVGRLLLQKNDHAAARQQFKAAIKLDASFLPAHIGLGDSHFSEGNTKVASALLEKSYQMTGNLILLLRLEDFFIDTGAPDRILEIYKAGLQEHPQDIVMKFYLGRLYYRLEMIDDSYETLSDIESRVESFPDLFKILGNIYVRRGELNMATEAFKKGLNLKNRITIPYYCPLCDFHTVEWAGRCGRCSAWNSYEATPILVDKERKPALIEAPYAPLPVPMKENA